MEIGWATVGQTWPPPAVFALLYATSSAQDLSPWIEAPDVIPHSLLERYIRFYRRLVAAKTGANICLQAARDALEAA